MDSRYQYLPAGAEDLRKYPSILHTETSEHEPLRAARPKKVSARRRIGAYGLFLIFGGIPLQLAITAFLGYLWYQQGTGPESSTTHPTTQRIWRTIVLNVWMAPTITLASVVLRVVVGVQLVVCTGLTAGLILESASAGFEEAPKLSVLRAYNSGPLDVVLLTLRRVKKIGLSRVSLPELLITLLYLIGLALQFTSTLLVSDLGETGLNTDPELVRVPIVDAAGQIVSANGYYMWNKSPGTWRSFGEERSNNSTLQAEVSDTGTIFRALLPFESQSRLRLRSYDGLAVMQEARTICVPAELGGSSVTLFGFTDEIALEGTVSASMAPFHSAGFTFIDPLSRNDDRDERAAMENRSFVCPFYNVPNGSKAIRGDNLTMAICTLGDPGFQRFLLVNAHGSYANWYPQDKPLEYLERTSSTSNGWATYVPAGPRGKKDALTLTASICAFKYNHTVQSISASTPATPKEMSIQWNTTTQSWSTAPILSLLGVLNTTLHSDASRGIFTLHSHTVNAPSHITNFDTGVAYQQMTDAMNSAFDRGISSGHDPQENFNRTLGFCTACDTFGSAANDTVHPANVLLVGAALNATDNPAAALDALWASWTQTLYSSAIGQFDGTGWETDPNVAGTDAEKVKVVWSTTVLAPRRWRGLAAVAGLLIMHVVATLAVLGLFAGRTTWSFYGGLWQAVAQVAEGDGVREVLREVSSVEDAVVKRVIRAKGLEGREMRVMVDGETGKVRLVRAARWKGTTESQTGFEA